MKRILGLSLVPIIISHNLSNLDFLPQVLMEKLKNAASPLDFFVLFFYDDILKLICSESNRYAEKYIEGLNNNDKILSEYLKKFTQFTPSTIMLYIGCLLYMGLVQLPEKKNPLESRRIFSKNYNC